MSAATAAQTALPARPGRGRAVVLALVRAELRRLVRLPLVPAGLAISLWMLWSTRPVQGEWPGAAYEEMATTSMPLLFAISVTAATSFHRERTDIAAAAPVREAHRALARLLAMTPLVALAAVFAAVMARRQRDLGGLWLGDEPGRITDALHTLGELSQHVVLAVLAVAVGAALGRRTSHLAAAIPVLFVFWFVASVYWLFGAPAVTPFAVLQAQPVHVPVGPETADPLGFPASWLLEAPTEYSRAWTRQLVSETLAWWHDVWLLGLALLVLAAVVPRGAVRRWLLVGGPLLAALGAAVQMAVIP